MRPASGSAVNATTPLEPEVREILRRFLTDELGHEGRRTHDYGTPAVDWEAVVARIRALR